MLLNRMSAAISRWFTRYVTPIATLGLAVMTVALPFLIFSDDLNESLRAAEIPVTVLRGILVSFNGALAGYLISTRVYNKRLEAAEQKQLDRELEVLNRFRDTVTVITKNHVNSLSEAYAYRATGTKQPTGKRSL